MKSRSVHVFAGSFRNGEAAMEFSEQRYPEEPAEDASDEEYRAWEAVCGTSELRTELGTWLDSDFVETIFGEGRDAYLASILVDPNAARSIAEQCVGANTYVLVYNNALHDPAAALTSTRTLRYCGQHACDLTRQ